MRYYLDTEFNGFGGELISLALVREDGEWVSFIFGCDDPTPWVAEHVIPNLKAGELTHDGAIGRRAAAFEIITFIADDKAPVIIADWPEDIAHFCSLMLIRPGHMVGPKRMTFELIRMESYPTELVRAVQHNAWWDAMALRARHQAEL